MSIQPSITRPTAYTFVPSLVRPLAYGPGQAHHPVTFGNGPVEKKPGRIRSTLGSFRNGTFWAVEKGVRLPEFWLRCVMNRFMERKFKKDIDMVHENLKKLDPKSPEYMAYVWKLAHVYSLAKNIETEINTEDPQFKELVDSDEPAIFIYNHDHQSEDPILLSTFFIRMYYDILKNGKGGQCPRPQIIMNEDILTSQSQKLREIYEMMGAVGVDSSIFTSRKQGRKNGRTMIGVMDRIIKGTHHTSIFPEGRMSAFAALNLRQKFQTGVGEMVRIIARKRGRVKVIPVGFAYESKREAIKPEDQKSRSVLGVPVWKKRKHKVHMGRIYLGKPIIFQMKKDQMYTSIGNVTEENATPAFQSFFFDKPQPAATVSRWRRALHPFRKAEAPAKPAADKPKNPFVDIDGVQSKLITEQGLPVTGKFVNGYLADIMAENLIICRDMAKKTLPQSSQETGVNLY